MATQDPIARINTDTKPADDFALSFGPLSPASVRETHDSGFGETIAPTPEEIEIMLELMMVALADNRKT